MSSFYRACARITSDLLTVTGEVQVLLSVVTCRHILQHVTSDIPTKYCVLLLLAFFPLSLKKYT